VVVRPESLIVKANRKYVDSPVGRHRSLVFELGWGEKVESVRVGYGGDYKSISRARVAARVAKPCGRGR